MPHKQSNTSWGGIPVPRMSNRSKLPMRYADAAAAAVVLAAVPGTEEKVEGATDDVDDDDIVVAVVVNAVDAGEMSVVEVVVARDLRCRW